jgi:hypothetical protein
MKFNYLVLISAVILASACKKTIDVSAPNFDVTTSATTFKVNDSVNFKFQGNPGLLYFYSGTTFNDYAYDTGRTTTAGPVQVSFSSTLAAGTQKSQLSVLLSTNFNGKYDSANVNAATWSDITSRFALATSTTSLASGKANIPDLAVNGKPFYIAFKYVTVPQTANGTPRQSVIQNVLLETNTADYGVQTVATQTNLGFQLVTEGTHQVVGGAIPSTVAATIITLNGNTTAGFTEFKTTDWAISQVNLVDKFDFGFDKSISIKGLADVAPTSYTYVYTKAGTYKATFVAANNTINDTKKVVKQIIITVTQ